MTTEQLDKDLSAKFLDSQKVGAEARERFENLEALDSTQTKINCGWADRWKEIVGRLHALESSNAALRCDSDVKAGQIKTVFKRLGSKLLTDGPDQPLVAEISRLNTEINELLSRQDRDRAMIERLESRIEILDQSSVPDGGINPEIVSLTYDELFMKYVALVDIMTKGRNVEKGQP